MPKCSQCGQSMPTEGFCPSCGHLVIGGAGQGQQPRPAATAPRRSAQTRSTPARQGLVGCLLILGIIITVIVGNSLFGTKPEPKPDKLGAWVAAQDFVRRQLKTPGSADFGWQMSDEQVEYLGDGRFQTVGWVDAQNLFGAKIRHNFMCIVRESEDGESWHCESIAIKARN